MLDIQEATGYHKNHFLTQRFNLPKRINQTPTPFQLPSFDCKRNEPTGFGSMNEPLHYLEGSCMEIQIRMGKVTTVATES